ncbi:hypothetical protein EPN52_13620 [bacterium]|nr:MAG: hypothetical protein EPN52_13620 [bacterium]
MVVGIISALVGAGIEAGVIFTRFMSAGHAPEGSRLGLVAIIGAIVGAIVGWIFGSITRPRKRV